MEPVLILESPCFVGSGQLACDFDFHAEDRIVHVVLSQELRCESLKDLRAVDRADADVHRRRIGADGQSCTLPVIPCESSFTLCWTPEIGADPDTQVACSPVVVRRDDNVLVGFLRGVVEDFPAAVVLYATPCWSDPTEVSVVVKNLSTGGNLPKILKLPIETSKLSFRQPSPSSIKLDLGSVELRLEDLSGVTPGREVSSRVGLVDGRVPHFDCLSHLTLAD